MKGNRGKERKEGKARKGRAEGVFLLFSVSPTAGAGKRVARSLSFLFSGGGRALVVLERARRRESSK